MAVEDGRRIIDQDTTSVIYPEDNIIIDSSTNGTRKITYEALCQVIAETLGISVISTKANGAMQKSVYDADQDGVVDNAENLDGHSANYFATAQGLASLAETVSGKMTKSVYDSDNDGVVDNAAKVNNHTVHSDVPAQAVFTDTVYDDTQVRNSIGDLNNLETEDKSSLVVAINEVNDKATSGDSLGLTVQNGKLCAVYNT